MEIRAQFPEKLAFLFEPHRYKVARGGRGSGKSWSFARALLIQGQLAPLRIGCFREVQKTIKDSVHAVLKDQVALLGLRDHYEVLANEIRGRNGTQILFGGLSDHTVESIKSFEGMDRAWVEEGQTVSNKSWTILIPTIRKAGSEIWISYNPDLDTDETHQRFTVRSPHDCVNVFMNYNDNPWFNDILEQERLACLRDYPQDYPNIWEGKCRPAEAGAIYYNEMEDAAERIINLPHDPKLKVHVVVDLGWNDAMSIIMVQKNASEIRIIDYIEDTHKKLSEYSQMLRLRPYSWGRMLLPHDDYSEDVKADSAYKILTGLGWDIPPREAIVEMNVENGIKAARMLFPRVYFDKNNTVRLVECLKRYRRVVSIKTDEAGESMHDQYSQGADAFRYLAVGIEQLSNEDWGSTLTYPSLGVY